MWRGRGFWDHLLGLSPNLLKSPNFPYGGRWGGGGGEGPGPTFDAQSKSDKILNSQYGGGWGRGPGPTFYAQS